MQENKQKESWQNVEEMLAAEIISSVKKESAAKNVGIACVTTIASIAIAGLLIVNSSNTKQFLDYLSEYDFVSQDGEGYNYYNSNVKGDVNNGTENKETEKQT